MLEDKVAVDTVINLSRLYDLVGSKESDKLKNAIASVVSPVSIKSGIHITQNHFSKSLLKTSLTLPEARPVSLTIFDVAGNVAIHIPQKHFQAGNHEMVIDVQHLPAGVYLCRYIIGTAFLNYAYCNY